MPSYSGRCWIIGPLAWDWVYYLDRYPPPGGFAQATGTTGRPGGAGANVARALTTCGVDVHFVGYVGDDQPGRDLVADLEERSIDVTHVRRGVSTTSQVLVFIDSSGERTMIGVTADQLPSVHVPVEQVTSGDLVYFAAWHGEFAPVILELRSRGAIIATAPPESPNEEVAAHFLIGSVTQYPNTALSDPYSAYARSGETTLEAVVMTNGRSGASVYHRDGHFEEAAHVVRARDTTGAGDSFTAGFLHRVMKGGTLEEGLRDGVRWGTAAVQVEESVPPAWSAVFGS